MATIRILDNGCRGCTLCVDTCPVAVFEFDEIEKTAVVACQQDCLGCLSCYYVCPSQCIEVGDVPVLRPFHRLEELEVLMQRFLQAKATTTTLSAEDCEEARRDVAARLLALSATVTETLGRGIKAVGRRSGALAATHLPEMYEEVGLEQVLAALQKRFRHAFDFDFKLSGLDASLTFHPCGLCRVVEDAGGKVGEAVLCQLFHDYWAGLLAAFVGTHYRYEVPQAGKVCQMELHSAS